MILVLGVYHWFDGRRRVDVKMGKIRGEGHFSLFGTNFIYYLFGTKKNNQRAEGRRLKKKKTFFRFLLDHVFLLFFFLLILL